MLVKTHDSTAFRSTGAQHASKVIATCGQHDAVCMKSAIRNNERHIRQLLVVEVPAPIG